MSVQLLGYSIEEASLDRLVARVVEEVTGGSRLRLFAMNPAKVVLAEREPALDAALRKAEVLYPDGYGVCLAARLLSGTRLSPLPGVELGNALVRKATERDWGVFLLGARPEVNEEASRALRRRHSDLRVVGTQHGYFRPHEEEVVIERIRTAAPELLLVALGSPRQEIWIDRHFDMLGASVAMGLGGSFDVYAGRVSRAPASMRRARLEWLYRIAREPRRVRAFLDTHPRFFARVARELVARRGPV